MVSENCFFQMLLYAYSSTCNSTCVNLRNDERHNPGRTYPEWGKQNTRAKKLSTTRLRAWLHNPGWLFLLQGLGCSTQSHKLMFCMYTREDILSWCQTISNWTTVRFKGCCLYPVQLQVSTILEKQVNQIHRLTILCSFSISTGSPSSRYEHRRASALLRNIQNLRICMGKNLSFL